MKTLIVNSYHSDPVKKIEPYVKLVSLHSEYKVEKDINLDKDYDLTGYDAVILSGSPNLVSLGIYPKRFLSFLQNLKIPTLGICYGHQMLGRAYGAEVKSGKRMEGYEQVRLFEFTDLFFGLEKEISVVESHQEFIALETLQRADFVLTAESDSCAVEAIRHAKLPIYGTQFHFERSGPIGEKIIENFYNKIVKKYTR
uniref:Glutamine amidotransferase domain-containing protein n=1 Tax=candidate division WOR-3 bacterium TaxID=2052148 RepID=A0A7C6AA92_UNCW3